MTTTTDPTTVTDLTAVADPIPAADPTPVPDIQIDFGDQSISEFDQFVAELKQQAEGLLYPSESDLQILINPKGQRHTAGSIPVWAKQEYLDK